MDIATEQQRCARVPEIMPAYGGQPSVVQQGLEVTIYYVLGVEGSALAGSENKS